MFATEAKTLRGAVLKLMIVYLALGDTAHGGDEDLEAFQDLGGEPWFASVMRDFERLV